MEWITDPQAWIALGTLTVLEIVLGIDNIVFIAILADKLPEHQRQKARRIGLLIALVTRLLLLASLKWIMGLVEPLFHVFGHAVSGRDLILIFGGLFLLGKSTMEIHERLEGSGEKHKSKATAAFTSVVIQIGLLDIVFSLDSVITAIGLADQLAVMVIAVVIAVIVMMVFVNPISDFVNRRPTVKMLALAFLLLIGFTLVAEGLHFHVPKGYVYFAMAFSAFVEFLNLKLRKKSGDPVKLRSLPIPDGTLDDRDTD